MMIAVRVVQEQFFEQAVETSVNVHEVGEKVVGLTRSNFLVCDRFSENLFG